MPNKKLPFIRVGVDYWKIIKKKDRFGILQTELKRWNKAEIIQDYSKNALYDIPKYDDFIIEPNNVNYKSEVHNCYNMYSKFAYKPKEGQWKWTKILLEHIFGSEDEPTPEGKTANQYYWGMVYLQCLYLYPKKALPVLALVSEERQTGKSTFIDWLNAIFGNNMMIINPNDISSDFNGSYADKNIIAIEETIIEKSHMVEKIKSLSTQKFISVNMKHVSHFKIPFFGKIIMASNNEDKFIKVDSEEIRFFVRKIGSPKHPNHNILDDMVNEIPAFLHHLKTLPEPDFSKSRMVIPPKELENDTLKIVKESSKTWLYKELLEYFTDYFLNDRVGKDLKEVSFTIKMIKERWFVNEKNVSFSYLKQAFLHDFKLKTPLKNTRFWGINEENTTGKQYILHRNEVIPIEEEINKLLENNDIENGDYPF